MSRILWPFASTKIWAQSPTVDAHRRLAWQLGDVEARRKINAADEAKWRNLGKPK